MTRSPDPPRHRRPLGLLALACIALQLGGALPLAAAALAIWLAALAALDPVSLRRLWMPRFWLLTVAFALGSGLLLGKNDIVFLGLGLSRAGIAAGALMVVRGAFIFALAAWGSRAMREEDIRWISGRLGAPALGAALPTALQLLPELQERYRELSARRRRAEGGSRRLRRVYDGTVELLCEAARLAEELTGTQQVTPASEPSADGAGSPAQPLLIAVFGPAGSGKTSGLTAIAARLGKLGITCGGVIQPAIHEGNRRVGYLLRDVQTGEERAFARRRRAAPGEPGFAFDEAGWRWASQRLADARQRAVVVLVDELGRLEAGGGGHMPALLEPQPAQRATVLVAAVRAGAIADIEEHLGPFDVLVDIAAGEDAVSAAAQLLADWATRASPPDLRRGDV